VFSVLAHGAAILTLLLLAASLLAAVRCRTGHPGIRPELPVDQRVGPRAEQVRRPGDDLRHAETSLIALLIAVPVSFGIALFLTELSPGWLRARWASPIELLAAVPSIVYGMWGLLVFSPVLSTYVQQPLQACWSTCRCCARWCPARRWASASCRPASSSRS
jgi:phosphate transport system permease protein